MDEFDIDELRRDQIAMRWHRQALASHPDCRDPDHPGCKKCMELDECSTEQAEQDKHSTGQTEQDEHMEQDNGTTD